MAALDVFKAIGPQTDTDFLAIDILPVLWQFSLGPLLNLSQFQAYMMLIKSLSSKIENEQTRKLQELGANSTTTVSASRNDLMSFGGVGGTNGINDANGAGEVDFEALVRGGNQTTSSGGDMLGEDPWANASASASSSATLASRPPPNRTRSSNNASPAATFSWSTPPPASPHPTNLSAPRGVNRTITPDNTLSTLNSSFPALAPSNPGIGGLSQQQTRPAMSMNSMTAPAITPSTTTPSYSTQSSGIDWSKAGGSSSVTANPWGNTSATESSTSGLSSVSLSPPPQQPRPQSNPYSAFSIAPPPSTSSNTFHIAPPPARGNRVGGTGAMNNMGMASRMAQNQNQNQNQSQTQQRPSQAWGSNDGGSLI